MEAVDEVGGCQLTHDVTPEEVLPVLPVLGVQRREDLGSIAVLLPPSQLDVLVLRHVDTVRVLQGIVPPVTLHTLPTPL